MQIYHPQPAKDAWAHFPVRSLDHLPQQPFFITSVDFTDTDITDEDLLRLLPLQNLAHVFLDGTKVTDSGVSRWLSDSAQLSRLSLERTSLSIMCLKGSREIADLMVRQTKFDADKVAIIAKRWTKSCILHESTIENAAVDPLPTGVTLKFDRTSRIESIVEYPEDCPLTVEAWILPSKHLGFRAAKYFGLEILIRRPRMLRVPA